MQRAQGIEDAHQLARDLVEVATRSVTVHELDDPTRRLDPLCAADFDRAGGKEWPEQLGIRCGVEHEDTPGTRDSQLQMVQNLLGGHEHHTPCCMREQIAEIPKDVADHPSRV